MKNTTLKSQLNLKDTLKQLIRLDRPIKELLQALESFGLDAEQEEGIVLLDYQDIAHIIERYLKQELSSSDVHEWASVLELRDDIQFGSESQHVFHVIFKLATPELEGSLTQQKAKRLIKVLYKQTPTESDIDKAYE